MSLSLIHYVEVLNRIKSLSKRKFDVSVFKLVQHYYLAFGLGPELELTPSALLILSPSDLDKNVYTIRSPESQAFKLGQNCNMGLLGFSAYVCMWWVCMCVCMYTHIGKLNCARCKI